MLLVELQPEWIKFNRRRGLGVRFECPDCKGTQVCVLFLNPLDAGPSQPHDDNCPGNNYGHRWARSGMSFEDLTLSPSIDCSGYSWNQDPTLKSCKEGGPRHWHGFILHGEVR